MKKKSSSSLFEEKSFTVSGTIRNHQEQPVPKVLVQVYSKGIREMQLLGEASTDDMGAYAITYNTKQVTVTSIIVQAYDAQKKLLKETGELSNGQTLMQVDVELDAGQTEPITEFERLVQTISPLIEDIPLTQLTEDNKHRDISFITKKTGLAQSTVEKVAMAFRFETLSSLPAQIWFGLLCTNPANPAMNENLGRSGQHNFEARLDANFDALMHTSLEELMNNLQKAIDQNIISITVVAQLPDLKNQLEKQIMAFAKQHPVSGEPSILYKKASMAGLKDEELPAFIEAYNNHKGSEENLWKQLGSQAELSNSKNLDQVQAVFKLSRLTENQLPLTEGLIKSAKIKTLADVRKMAENTSGDWEELVKKHNVELRSDAPGKNQTDKIKKFARQLESNFTREFPTAAFTARLKKDSESKLPHRDKISKFLQENEHFDLLHSKVGQFVKENKTALAQEDAPELERQLRRIQRVFKLSPRYETTNALLKDNIHSAQQVFRMGKDNFVNTYGKQIGEKEAEQVFLKADDIFASALALTGDLQSMADASSLNAFPNFSQSIQTLSQELPNLETLFGHTDFFDTTESRSVYGAPAYLTDILHFLENRLSTLDPVLINGTTETRRPTVKDLLLLRRPDIADIDLEERNTNTEVPYIDIACEIMEDFISAPLSAMFAATTTMLSKLVKGPIDSSLLSTIKSMFVSSGHGNFGNLLSSAATVSDVYTETRLKPDNTFAKRDNWIISDSQIVIKVTNLGTNLQCRVLHQTLLPTEAVSAGPEYINVKAYDLIKTAKRPFTLPFDLFNTEGELYLEKLGTKKQDLINIFSRVGPPTLNSAVDINMGHASLGINQAEQNLIFTADPTNQSLYWGNVATATSIPVDVFEKLTGLNYVQINELVALQFINPARDIRIEHDDLSADITKARIINLTTTKLDAIHRFLRLWRKTTLTMDELDAFIVTMSSQNGFSPPLLNPIIADELRHFLVLQQSFQLTPFELLGFYGVLDTTHGLPDCQYNKIYQNSAITNPIHPKFSLAAMQSPASLGDPDKLVICSILQISLSDLNEVLSFTGATLINVITLSKIYRHVKLAQVLGITVTDLLTLLRLTNAIPFQNPAFTSQFVSRYKQMQSCGFSIDDVNYVLRHQNNAARTLIPTTDQRQAALDQLQSDLMAIKTAVAAPVDANGVLLTKWLSDAVLKWDTSLVNRLMDILTTMDTDTYRQKITDNTNFLLNLRVGYNDAVLRVDLAALPVVGGATITIPASLAAQLSFDTDKKQLVLRGVINTADRDALLALSTDTAYRAAINALFNKITTPGNTGNSFFTSATDVGNSLNNLLFANIVDRYVFFINKLVSVYRSRLQQDALTKNISAWFNVDKKMVGTFLTNVPEITADFTTDNFINKVIDTTTVGNPYPNQANRYQFLAKTFFVFNKLNISPLAQEHALKLFFTSGPTRMGCLDFKMLPLAAVGGSVSTYPGFEALLNLRRFDQLLPTRILSFTAGGAGTYDIYGQLIALGNLLPTGVATEIPGALTQFTSNLAFAYGWSTADLQTVLTANFTQIANFTAASSIMLRLYDIFTTLQQLGVSLVDAQSWCAASLTITDSTKIKNTLKRKSSTSDWLQITKPLQDKLRERKRDALIAYLLTNPGTQTWKDAEDLYGYFLLDVQMCSCQPTSRIVQATNSVQLFVQRCFLGLEDSIVVKTKPDSNLEASPDSNWLQWKWMKNFRVWQANVKVFLYPENWIEPELLPNEIKSPFLKELETELLQNDVTAINAENAFHSYLEKLDAVSRLEVKGMWYDQPSETLHVFARTYGGNPRIYYHRELINDRRWTPWKKIDLDITGDHIMPAVYNNRLYLFWAVFTEQAGSTPSAINIPAPNLNGAYTIPVGAPNKLWQIQLAFSEYKNGKWTAKKISENNNTGQIVKDQINFPDKSKFLFTPLDIPGYDYSQIFDVNHVPIEPVFDEFARKIGPSLRQNGKLVISCYYYDYVADDSFENCQYVGSFQLDPVKGYPTQLTVNYKVKPIQANRHIERSNRQSRMVNMLDAETFPNPENLPPPGNGLPGSGTGGEVLVSDQAGGAFGNMIPMQMDLNDRLKYMRNIYFNTFNGIQFQLELAPNLPYFYQDQKRSYYVVNEYTDNGSFEFLYSDFLKATYTLLDEGETAYGNLLAQVPVPLDFFISRYFNFHHPLVDYFRQRLFVNGIDGLMDRDTQLKGDNGYDPDPNKFDFESYFQPVIQGFETIYSGANLPAVIHNGVTDPTPGYPKDDVDFNLQSGYGLYNWELFFHAPLMIAERLSQNQQFEDADRWYRYIFNPMDTSAHEAPNKFWNTKPFFFNTSTDYVNQRIDNILKGINDGQFNLEKDVEDWRKNPFQPHFIAQFRTVAYQKAAVMKYVGHLVRHGDFLFSQQSRESVNEATQLYILAAEILGPKPEVIPSVGQTGVDNFSQLEQKLDAFSDALVDVENLLSMHTIIGYNGLTPISPDLPRLQTMYFGVPMNENLAGPTGYWDVVADRLFKIRHCLDIDGNLAPLSLFSAPIDPGMLVRASAAGLDIGTILNDVNAPLPLYRFMTMMQKATELCNEVKSLGGSLLSVLEKKDAEAMALLRSGQEIKLLGAMLSIKEKQIQDAQLSLEGFFKQRELIVVRKIYYTNLLSRGLSAGENQALDLNKFSAIAEGAIGVGYVLAGGLKFIPQFVLGFSGLGSPVATAATGGEQVGGAAESAVKTLSALATAADKVASILLTKASYERRSQEWVYQVNLANKELEQIGKQIEGSQIRLEIAKQDLVNQQLQIDQAIETGDFMRSKFTNEELFNWMSTQLSNTYFKSYQLTYDVAKKAERCFRYELGLSDSAFINFGYWDSLKKGLLAGELLAYDIRKMELAYLDQNKRELELTKPISLSQLDPVALLKLKTTGECFINLPEELFDMDYPGHYMRRIKSVSITIPCISGPYTTVSTKLTMTNNSMRVIGIAASDATQYPRKLSGGVPTDDPRFRDGSGSLQSIATSSAQNDSGLFELNFRDERYLPFEGAGAISLWHLELPAAVRQFDYNSISDVIIHLKYTARDGGEALKANATASLTNKINQMLVSIQDRGLMRIFSAKNDLATEWYRFLNPANATDDQVLTLNLDKTRFPLFVQDKMVKITSVELIADAAEAINNMQVIAPATAATSVNLAAGTYGSWKNGTAEYLSNKKDTGTWVIKNPVANKRLTDVGAADNTVINVNNLAIIVHYEVS